MQRLTITERMLVVALLPLVLFMLLAQAFGGSWTWLDDTVRSAFILAPSHSRWC